MTRLKQLLKDKIQKKALELIPSSYDIIGDVLIFTELPSKLAKYEKIIGEMIFSSHNNIKVIAKKTKKYSGRYRLPKFRIIAGEKRLETTFKENGCTFRIDIGKAYFSPRLSGERKRIIGLIKPNETVLVMFSGIGVYPIEIAKISNAKEIFAIELNEYAHHYAEINAKLNKADNIKIFSGDVKKILPKISKKFDRIIMPLPKGASEFLDIALKKIKKHGVVHYYDFAKEEKFEKVAGKIELACKKAKKKFKILNIQKCGHYAPRVFRVCVDFVVK